MPGICSWGREDRRPGQAVLQTSGSQRAGLTHPRPIQCQMRLSVVFVTSFPAIGHPLGGHLPHPGSALCSGSV